MKFGCPHVLDKYTHIQMAIVKIVFNTQENSYIVANLLQPDEFVINSCVS